MKKQKASKPEYVGLFPARQDLSVPSDTAKLKTGWKIIETGTPVFRPFKGWVDEFNEGLKKNSYYGDLLDKYAIRDINELKKGTRIAVDGLAGIEYAKVTIINYKRKIATASSKYNIYPLNFVNGAWCCDTMINKKCYAKVLKNLYNNEKGKL